MSYQLDSWVNNLEKFVAKYGRLPTEFDPDYLEMLRMSKYRILDVPDGQPGQCANCGASKNDGRKYIDIMKYIDWYGDVHFCDICLNEIATEIGLFKNLEAQLLAAEQKSNRIKELQEQGVELHETVTQSFTGLKEFYDNLYSLGDGTTSDNPGNVESYKSPTGAPAADGNKQNADGSKSRTIKSSPSSGRKDIRSFADLLGESNQSATDS